MANDFKRCIYSDNNLRLLFDTYRPRPHFIITRDKNIGGQNQLWEFLQVSNEAEIHKVFELCTQFISKENKDVRNDDVIFSLHTGKFCTSNIFHAHLCVNKNLYKKMFEEKIPATYQFQLSKKLKVRENTDKESYLANIDNYEIEQKQKYAKFVKEDEKFIGKGLGSSEKDVNMLNQMQKGDVEIVFHPSLPKIGFRLKTGGEVLKQYCKVLQAMKEFASSKGYFDKRIGGSHLCIYLNNVRDPSFDVTGYIRVTGVDYFQLIEDKDQAKRWLNNYITSDYYAQT